MKIGLLLGAAVLALGLPSSTLTASEPAVEIEAGYHYLTGARRSAQAVFGSAGGLTLGAGARLGLGKRWFVRAGARYFARSGERVFVADPSAEVFRLGHPLSVRIVPIMATLGCRFPTRARATPYAGLGGGLTVYRERSLVGGLSETERLTRPSGHVLAGLELGRGRLRGGAELCYSIVPGAIGVGGVSAVYREKDIGGLSLLARFIVTQATRK